MIASVIYIAFAAVIWPLPLYRFCAALVLPLLLSAALNSGQL